MTPEDEARAVGEVSKRLATRFPGLSLAIVTDEVERAHKAFVDSRIRDFVPLFVERMAAEHLATAALT
jgi:hypothetical protein